LQDDVAPADPDAVRRSLEAELGGPVEAVFAAFDWEPIAAASIGQAHRARLVGGPEVIVKIQRPGIDEMVERDIDVLETLGNTVQARAAWAREYRVVDLIQEFTGRLRDELDYRVEATHATEIASNLESFEHIHIPHVFQEFTTSRVLVME